MNKSVLLLCFLGLGAGLPAQIPPNWHSSPPRNTATVMYNVGISQPVSTEQDAYKGAWQNALYNFATSITTRFQGQTDITVQSQGYSSGIEDAFTVNVETSSFSTSVPLSGVSETARKIERQGSLYVAYILASMSVEDYNEACRYVDNDAAAARAYGFFADKGLAPVTGNKKPAGFSDYYTWLLNNCISISVQDQNQNALLEQLDLFIKKLYKNAASCAELLDGRSARIIYHSARYYNGILRALQTMNLFTIQRESSQLVLRPVRANVLGELRSAVAAMKDSAKFVITGLETLETRDGETVNPGNLVISQFRTIASRQFGMQAVDFAIPRQYLEGYVHDEAIIRHIVTNKESFPARYLVICVSGTRLDKGMAEYRIPPVITASCRFTLFDVVTGETLESEEARTLTGGFSPAGLEDRAVIEESRRALQFLYNPKTQPGLGEIIRGVLEKL